MNLVTDPGADLTKGNKKHSIMICGHRTSLTLEPEFWEALTHIAAEKKTSIAQIVADIDERRSVNLSSALRVYILNYYKNKRLLCAEQK